MRRVGLFVVGTSRSGTTLLQRLANEAGVASIPEETHVMPRMVWRLSPSTRLKLLRNSRMDLVDWCAHATPEAASILRGIRRSPDLGRAAYSPAEMIDALGSAMSTSDLPLGEKTPMHLQWWSYLSRARPEAKFVVLVRDPRDVIASMKRLGWLDRGSTELAAERWRQDQLDTVSMLRSLSPGRALLVRYEDLCRGTEDEAKRSLARFMGAGPTQPRSHEPVVRGFDARKEPWKARSSQPLDTQAIGTHREVLHEREVQAIEKICAREMVEFGYSARAGRSPATVEDPDAPGLARYRISRRVLRRYSRRLSDGS